VYASSTADKAEGEASYSYYSDYSYGSYYSDYYSSSLQVSVVLRFLFMLNTMCARSRYSC
jgi:hypothetical protein